MLITGLRTLPSRRPYQGVQLFPSAAATGNEEWGWGVWGARTRVWWECAGWTWRVLMGYHRSG